MWCDLWQPVTCRKRWNCKIKEINTIILMFFFIFYGLWTSVTFDSSIRGDPSKKFWRENNSNCHLISITQNINFAPCDKFSQITLHIYFIEQIKTMPSFNIFLYYWTREWHFGHKLQNVCMLGHHIPLVNLISLPCWYWCHRKAMFFPCQQPLHSLCGHWSTCTWAAQRCTQHRHRTNVAFMWRNYQSASEITLSITVGPG